MSLFTLASELGEHLSSREMFLATAESCTGGWLAKTVTDVPGSSSWFDRGFITYTNKSKQQMLGVSSNTLGEFGAISEQTVREMALGALERSDAQITVSISGIAGPGGGSVEKPVGTVYMGFARSPADCDTKRFQFDGTRDQIREQAVNVALRTLVDLLQRD